jgi:hypothetical protein
MYWFIFWSKFSKNVFINIYRGHDWRRNKIRFQRLRRIYTRRSFGDGKYEEGIKWISNAIGY